MSNANYDYEDEFLKDVQDFETKQMIEKANNVVLTCVATTIATGAVPIPFADAPLLIGEQVIMLTTINGIFKFDVSKDVLNSLVVATLVVGGAVSGGTAGALTIALGKVYIEVCKAIKMGKLNESDLTKKEGLELLKKKFKEQMKK